MFYCQACKLFTKKIDARYNTGVAALLTFTEGRCSYMEMLLDFLTTVGTNVVSYFLIKAFENFFDNNRR